MKTHTRMHTHTCTHTHAHAAAAGQMVQVARLAARKTEDAEKLALRMDTARLEMARAAEFDYGGWAAAAPRATTRKTRVSRMLLAVHVGICMHTHTCTR